MSQRLLHRLQLLRDLGASRAQLAAEKINAAQLQQQLHSANTLGEVAQTQASATSCPRAQNALTTGLILVTQLAALQFGVRVYGGSTKLQAMNNGLCHTSSRGAWVNCELLTVIMPSGAVLSFGQTTCVHVNRPVVQAAPCCKSVM